MASPSIDPAAVRAELLRLELALARRRVEDLPGGSYEAVLDEGFDEIGASGRRWTREATLAALRDAEPTDAAIEAFAVRPLAPGVVLTTFDTGGERPARRASVWVCDGGRWRLRFHQGTPLTEGGPPSRSAG